MDGLIGKSRAERLSSNSSEEHSKCGFALLDEGRNIAADGTEGRRARHTPKTARHLLLKFEHPQVALGQIVSERHAKIVGKTQHGGLIAGKTLDQRPYLAFGRSAARFGHPPGGGGLASRPAVMICRYSASSAASRSAGNQVRPAALAASTSR